MMTCSEVRPILSLFLEKETEPLETLQTRRHLDECRACAARARRIDRVMESMHGLETSEPPADLAPLVMTRLQTLRERIHHTLSGQQALKWSGLAVLLGAGLASLTRSSSDLLRAIGRPLAPLAGLVGDPSTWDGLGEKIGGVVPAAVGLVRGAGGANLLNSAGSDVSVLFQVVGTALILAFSLAIPVLATTAWLLRHGARR